MMAYTMPQQRKQEESEQLRGERDQIKYIVIIEVFPSHPELLLHF